VLDGLTVGVAVAAGVDAATTTVPVISGCTLHLNVYVPGVSNRQLPLHGAIVASDGIGGGGTADVPWLSSHDVGFSALVKTTL
jgi:hypothetical protein